jgi:uridine kinase
MQDYLVDVYIHISGSKETKYMNRDISIDKIKDIFKPKVLLASEDFVLSENPELNRLLNQNYKFFWLNEEKKRISALLRVHYDVVVKLRPDVHLNSDLELFRVIDGQAGLFVPEDSKMDLSRLKVPTDKYICDIIAFADVATMDKYFDYYNSIPVLFGKTGGSTVNETLLHNYIEQMTDIKPVFLPINYFVILSLCNTIGITGDSGSGKSTLAEIVKELFTNSFLLECDRYHKWERNSPEWNRLTHLNPEANFLLKMKDDVFNLKRGNDIYQVDYDHQTGCFTDSKFIEHPAENLIVCGLHCLHLPDNIVNLKIFMDTDVQLKTAWKVGRDCSKRGYSVERIMKQIKDREPDYLRYILPQREIADVIIRMYTHVPFDKDKPCFNPPVYLKVGLNKKWNRHFLSIWGNVEVVGNFFYFDFGLLSGSVKFSEIIMQILLKL